MTIATDNITYTTGGDYAEGDIDKRQGIFIGDNSTVSGIVVGVNQGTIVQGDLVLVPEITIDAPAEPAHRASTRLWAAGPSSITTPISWQPRIWR